MTSEALKQIIVQSKDSENNLDRSKLVHVLKQLLFRGHFKVLLLNLNFE